MKRRRLHACFVEAAICNSMLIGAKNSTQTHPHTAKHALVFQALRCHFTLTRSSPSLRSLKRISKRSKSLMPSWLVQQINNITLCLTFSPSSLLMCKRPPCSSITLSINITSPHSATRNRLSKGLPGWGGWGRSMAGSRAADSFSQACDKVI